MALNPNQITVAPARIWVGGTAPVTGQFVSVNSQGVPSTGGTEVGFTNGPATVTVTGEVLEVMAEQALSAVRVLQTSEEATVNFTMKELGVQLIANILRDANYSTVGQAKRVTGGGGQCIDPQVVTLVALDPCLAFYNVFVFYRAYLESDFAIPFAKAEETMIEVTLKGLSDTNRPTGDQLYQWVQVPVA